MDPVAAIEPEPAAASTVFGDRVGLARRYTELLATDGVVRGLIGPRENGRLWSRHVLNSAVWHPLLASGLTVVDVGSGAGLPGIPLAIARPDLSVVLVEPLERRVVFLDEVVQRLALENVRVVRGRADQVTDTAAGADVVTSRAVAPLAKLAGWCAPLLRTGGKLMALKGSSAAEEARRDAGALATLGFGALDVIAVGGELLEEPTWMVTAVMSAAPKSLRRRAGRSDQREKPSNTRNSARRP